MHYSRSSKKNSKQPKPIGKARSSVCKENESNIIPNLTDQQNEETLPLHKHEQTVNTFRFECFICKMKFESQKATRHHLIQNHKRDVKCYVCNQNLTSLEREMHICTGLKSLNCSYCQQECTSTKSLFLHLNDCNKSEKLTYKCDHCPDYFFMKSLLSVHMENHKNEFVCNICTKSFATKILLSRHEKRHNAIGRK